MKFHLKMKHMELVKAGRYDVVRLVLRFLQRGKIRLGLGDTDWQVQQICESLNLCSYGDSRGYSQTFLLKVRC